MGERIVKATVYKGYRIEAEPTRKGGRYFDTFTVLVHRSSAPELQLSLLCASDMNEAQGFDTESDARESAMTKAKACVDEKGKKIS